MMRPEPIETPAAFTTGPAMTPVAGAKDVFEDSVLLKESEKNKADVIAEDSGVDDIELASSKSSTKSDAELIDKDDPAPTENKKEKYEKSSGRGRKYLAIFAALLVTSGVTVAVVTNQEQIGKFISSVTSSSESAPAPVMVQGVNETTNSSVNATHGFKPATMAPTTVPTPTDPTTTQKPSTATPTTTAPASTPVQTNATTINDTLAPAPTSTTPKVTTVVPTTTLPTPTSAAPVSTTASPAPTTATPAPTTATPEPTTATPKPTTSTPAPTTATSAPTTVTPVPTTATPKPTTTVPTPTTSSPAPETSAPSTSAPTPTWAAPKPTEALEEEFEVPTGAPTTAAAAPFNHGSANSSSGMTFNFSAPVMPHDTFWPKEDETPVPSPTRWAHP
ncbi:hypothetical protein ACHHYP_12845 [Achlya hypogyna]|uniref:Uncharacterized protein n=1 Tax=Achlya hypogyna TaxID=1202772 RepID=A0A1V9ZGB4_ACHHY|nr:hypothetical protein ACHHYP_12845 [Achlya hypogyna]